MKYSISKQFTLIFCLLMAGTILLCWFINSTFLEEYYIRDKQQVLLDAYNSLNQASSSGDIKTKEFDRELTQICEKYNISVIVLDAESIIIKTVFMDADIMTEQLLNNIFRGYDRRSDQILAQEENYLIWIVPDYNTRSEFVEIWGILDNGTYFLCRSALEGIKDSVSLANRFLAYVGIGAALLSGVIILYVTRKITDPIKELTGISQRMIGLDFEAKYQGNSKTEIALLGQNINELSQSLEKTISELKSANNELQRDLQHKNEIDEMRREFLSNISHELKTPIALIQGYAEGLQEDIHDDQESRDYYCEVIVDEAAKMNAMVKKLMALNELEYGSYSVDLERMDIVSLIRNYLESTEILVKQREARVQFLPLEPVFVWADEYKTEEVFSNYFMNALNHVAEQGRITISLTGQNKNIRISVFNEGKPIPEENMPFLWDKFYKVDKARTREYGGSGVGLSIVKATMEAMNQTYGVKNHENGVEFWFELERISDYEQ